jgi:hypothetical protein
VFVLLKCRETKNPAGCCSGQGWESLGNERVASSRKENYLPAFKCQPTAGRGALEIAAGVFMTFRNYAGSLKWATGKYWWPIYPENDD